MDVATICALVGATISLLTAVGGLITLGVTVGKYSVRFQTVEDNYAQLKKVNDDLKERLIRVEDMLIFKHKGASDYFAAKQSPRALNDIGLKVLSDMHGTDFIEKNKDLLFSKIDEYNPKTALDVEVASLNACISIANDDAFNDIKVFVYNYPTVKNNAIGDKEVTLEDAIYILSFPLRDMYLEEHKDILR